MKFIEVTVKATNDTALINTAYIAMIMKDENGGRYMVMQDKSITEVEERYELLAAMLDVG